MKKIISNYFVIAGAIMLLISGCKGKDAQIADDPKAVVMAFFERMSKKDIDGAAKLATKDSKATLDMMKKAIDAAEKMGMDKDKTAKDDPSEDFKNIVVGDAKIDGDKATVSITNKAKNDGTKDFPLVKEGGGWKVDFSMATLMKMGMDDKSGKNDWDNNSNDSDTTAIKDYMNMDTLKKGLEGMDSLLKSVDPEKMKEMMKELEKLKQ